MKRTRVVFAALVITSLTHAASALAAAEVKITIPYGPKHALVTDAYPGFISYVEGTTKGALKFKVFTSESLLPARGTVSGLRDGVAEMGIVVPPYSPAEFPHGALLNDLGIIGREATAMVAATMEFNYLNCSECLSEFIAQGIVYGGGQSTSAYYILSKPKITTLAEVKGKKIRSGGAGWNRWAIQVGAIPVSMPSNETYQALSANVIDGTIAAVATLQNNSLWDTAKQVTMLPLGVFNSVSPLAMGRGFWKERTLDERKAIQHGLAIAAANAAVRFDEIDRDVLKEAGARGISIHQPAGDLAAETEAFLAADLKTMAKTSEDQFGIKNATVKIERFVQLVNKWSKLVDPVKTDRAKLAEIYQVEIFDKVDPQLFGM